MPVVVHHDLVADALYIEARPGCAEWPQADRHAKNPVDLRPDRRRLGPHAVTRKAL